MAQPADFSTDYSDEPWTPPAQPEPAPAPQGPLTPKARAIALIAAIADEFARASAPALAGTAGAGALIALVCFLKLLAW
jgi:hypothetical protein